MEGRRDRSRKADATPITLAAGRVEGRAADVKIDGAHLWSPEDPFLYVLDTSTGGRLASRTRFGMREFRYDTADAPRVPERPGRTSCAARTSRSTASSRTRIRARCPGTRRGCGKLLVDLPKKLHWNAFRFCIGPVPDKWLDIADEAGLLDPERVLRLDRRAGLGAVAEPQLRRSPR